MHPKKLALIDDDKEYSEFLAQHLRGLGMQVSVYGDSNELLADADGFGHDFYLVDLMLPGVTGLELIKILRRRTEAGVLVVSGSVGPEIFKDVIAAGADMFLAKPVQFEQVALVIEAVQRRAGRTASTAAWRLDRRAGELVAPDGARVVLSDLDRMVMECFLDAQGEPVARESFLKRLGRDPGVDTTDDGLNATIHRLRRRIERATPALVPLQSKSRVGYVFRAPLLAV